MAVSFRECAQLLLREGGCPGGLGWSQQLFCTSLEAPCREEKVKGERKRISAVNPMQCSG